MIKAGVYLNKPQDFHNEISSCACFIEFQKRFLFLKKAPGRWCETRWGIPCGRIDAGEELIECMARELKEETGLTVTQDNLNYVGYLYVVHPDLIKNLHHMFYLKLNSSIKVKISDEHTDFKWVSEEHMPRLSLVPGQKKSYFYFNKLRKM
jgi:8-oxo-dGTP diphosphatase